MCDREGIFLWIQISPPTESWVLLSSFMFLTNYFLHFLVHISQNRPRLDKTNIVCIQDNHLYTPAIRSLQRDRRELKELEKLECVFQLKSASK